MQVSESKFLKLAKAVGAQAESSSLAVHVKRGVRDAGGTPMEFNTIAVSDGVSMGTSGMRASLVSREVIADSINAHAGIEVELSASSAVQAYAFTPADAATFTDTLATA